MSRDRQDKNRFNHSPFNTLKGLSVAEPAKQTPTAPAAPRQPVLPEETDESDLFAREMASLNVRPVTGKAVGQPGHGPAVQSCVTGLVEADGATEFLEAVGMLDKTFLDDPSGADEPPRARLRRMKQLERGQLKPAGELDLHGLTCDEALVKTRAFLAHAVRQQWPAIVIVTGKGLHSVEGPVLRRAVERLLDTSRDVVLEWGAAPRRFGGAGALVVFVKNAN